MEEEDHFTQTQLPALIAAFAAAAMTARLLPLQFSIFSLVLYISHHSLLILLSLLVPFYRQQWCHQLLLFFNKGGCQLQLFFNNDGCQPLTSWMGAHGWCNSSYSCCNCQWLLHINGNQPNNHPLCHSCGATIRLLLQRILASCSSSKLTILRASSAKFTWYLPYLSITRVTKAHLFSHKRITTTRWSTTSHLKSVIACLWDNIPLRAYQPCSVRNESSSLTPRYTTPPQTEIFISKCDNHYLSIFKESTHPGVMPALCSTQGTTPYFFVSLSLLVSRVQVAFHLYLWG